jgi:hypothetical protein
MVETRGANVQEERAGDRVERLRKDGVKIWGIVNYRDVKTIYHANVQ